MIAHISGADRLREMVGVRPIRRGNRSTPNVMEACEHALLERLARGWWTLPELAQFAGYSGCWVHRRLERLKRAPQGGPWQLARRPRKHAHYKPWEYHVFPVAVNVRGQS